MDVCFDNLIRYTYETYNRQVVILIDEYDKPILDVIEHKAQARHNRDFIKGLEAFKVTLVSLFAAIPYNNCTHNGIAAHEGFYVSVVYAYLASMDITVIGEDVTNRGRIDLTLLVGERVYILEFKVTDGKRNAQPLKQIQAKHYHEKFRNQGKEISLVGVTFDSEVRNVGEVVWEKVEG